VAAADLSGLSTASAFIIMVSVDNQQEIDGHSAFGLILALAATRVLSSGLYGVTATDPSTFAGMWLLVSPGSAIGLLASARRAAKVDPIVALRCE
jgi:hypothetical protein